MAIVFCGLQGEIILNVMISLYICLLTLLHIPLAFSNTKPTEQPSHTDSKQTRMYALIATAFCSQRRKAAPREERLKLVGWHHFVGVTSNPFLFLPVRLACEVSSQGGRKSNIHMTQPIGVCWVVGAGAGQVKSPSPVRSLSHF